MGFFKKILFILDSNDSSLDNFRKLQTNKSFE